MAIKTDMAGNIVEASIINIQSIKSVRLPLEKDGSTRGWLGWSDEPIGIDPLERMIVNPSMLREFGSQVLRERKVGILDGDPRRSLFCNQASYLKSTGWVNICINHPSGYSGWLYMFKLTIVLVDLLSLGFITKLTAYR